MILMSCRRNLRWFKKALRWFKNGQRSFKTALRWFKTALRSYQNHEPRRPKSNVFIADQHLKSPNRCLKGVSCKLNSSGWLPSRFVDRSITDVKAQKGKRMSSRTRSFIARRDRLLLLLRVSRED